MKKFIFFFLTLVYFGCSLLTNRVATPTFEPGTGVYTNSVTVTVSCLTPGATIYIQRYVTFHTNPNLSLPPGNIVSDNWTEYLYPLTFTTNSVYIITRVTLSAYATKDGKEPSATNSAIYELRKP